MTVYFIRFLPVIIIITIIIVIWLLASKKNKDPNLSSNPPWFYFIAFAIILFGLILVFLRFDQFSEKPGGNYIPPQYTNEGIVPGYVDR